MPCICIYGEKHSRGSSLAVAFAPAALGMTEGERIAEIAVIARDRRDRKILPLITRIALIVSDRKNILRQTGTDNSVYDQGKKFKLKFTCIFL
jgi:hypothetical protein